MGSGESFGKQLAVDDCVGVFVGLIDRTLNKNDVRQARPKLCSELGLESAGPFGPHTAIEAHECAGIIAV